MKKHRAIELVKKSIVDNIFSNTNTGITKGIYSGRVFEGVRTKLMGYFKDSEIEKIINYATESMMNDGKLQRIYYTGCDDYHWKLINKS